MTSIQARKKADKRTKPRGLTPRIRAMIEHMVFEGRKRDDAAKAAGITDRAARMALAKPEVLAHYNRELEVLRKSERARTFHRLIELRDQNENRNAAVSAARSLEQMSDDPARARDEHIRPGFVIQVNSYPAPQPARLTAPTIDAEPDPGARRWLDDRGEPAPGTVLWIDGSEEGSAAN